MAPAVFIMNKFEKTRMIATRTLQIAQGARPLVRPAKTDCYDIAVEEFDKKKIPLVVV
jgi:DNA-directed RNA polymerase subunit K/omega